MKVYKEMDAYDVRRMVWSGAIDTINDLDDKELAEVLAIIEDCYPDGVEETELNDIFWFEREWIAKQLGFNSYDEILERRKEEEE